MELQWCTSTGKTSSKLWTTKNGVIRPFWFAGTKNKGLPTPSHSYVHMHVRTYARTHVAVCTLSDINNLPIVTHALSISAPRPNHAVYMELSLYIEATPVTVRTYIGTCESLACCQHVTPTQHTYISRHMHRLVQTTCPLDNTLHPIIHAAPVYIQTYVCACVVCSIVV